MSFTTRAAQSLFVIPFVGLCTACGSSNPSRELVDARKAYQDAAHSESANLRPDELVDAKEALQAAEVAHADDPGSAEEQHLAYLAERRAQLAMVRGDEYSLRKNYEEKRNVFASTAKQYAVDARGELSDSKRKVAQTEEALSREQAQRLQAETLARGAIEDLKKVAMVKEEARGVVITLSGAVLFKTGESELLNTARAKLTDVAKALKDQQGDAQVTVEGYTDSRGSTEGNQKLSLERAQAVSSFLEQNGVDASRLSAKGMGESDPIADNATPEGRANNRRVEIVVGSNQSADAGHAKGGG